MYINTWQEEDDKARLFSSKNTQQKDKRQWEPRHRKLNLNLRKRVFSMQVVKCWKRLARDCSLHPWF